LDIPFKGYRVKKIERFKYALPTIFFCLPLEVMQHCILHANVSNSTINQGRELDKALAPRESISDHGMSLNPITLDTAIAGPSKGSAHRYYRKHSLVVEAGTLTRKKLARMLRVLPKADCPRDDDAVRSVRHVFFFNLSKMF
jgi:hypothetical protein